MVCEKDFRRHSFKIYYVYLTLVHLVGKLLTFFSNKSGINIIRPSPEKLPKYDKVAVLEPRCALWEIKCVTACLRHSTALFSNSAMPVNTSTSRWSTRIIRAVECDTWFEKPPRVFGFH